MDLSIPISLILIHGIYELELAHQLLAGPNKLPRGNYHKKFNILLESELTETAPGGEGEHDETGRENFVPRSIQCNIKTPCEHKFLKSVLRDLARSRGKETKYFSHLTGFSSNEKFGRVLEFFLPAGRRKNITYW